MRGDDTSPVDLKEPASERRKTFVDCCIPTNISEELLNRSPPAARPLSSGKEHKPCWVKLAEVVKSRCLAYIIG